MTASDITLCNNTANSIAVAVEARILTEEKEIQTVDFLSEGIEEEQE